MRTWLLGVCSALTAAACCWGPAALALLGLGGVGVGAMLGRAHAWFSGLAVALLAVGWSRYATELRRCRAGRCRVARGRLTMWSLILASVIVAWFAVGG